MRHLVRIRHGVDLLHAILPLLHGCMVDRKIRR